MAGRPTGWRPLARTDVAAVTGLLGRTDREWDGVVERTEDDVRALVTDGRGDLRCAGGAPDAVALVVPDTEVVVRVARDVVGRPGVLEEAFALVAGELDAGTPLWVPAGDEESAARARAQGLTPAYTDLQMRADVPPPAARPLAPPATYRWRDRPSDHSSVADEVHDLVCLAWGVPPHREAFRTRFEGDGHDPRLWVLLDRQEAPRRLAAAAVGEVRQFADGPFGVVAHLDVHPLDRRRGLGTAALGELMRRLGLLGLEQAQLGVHDDNASRAPDLYRSLGWLVVSAQTKWGRAR